MKTEFLFAAAIFLAGCSGQSHPGPTESTPSVSTAARSDAQSDARSTARSAVRVKVAAPTSGTIAKTVEVTGTLEPNRSVAIHAMEGGQVTQVLVDIGARVAHDELLLVLANPALTQAHIEAAAEAAAAQASWERLSSAFESSRGLTSRESLDRATSARASSAARSEALSARVALLELRAPFSGRITARHVDEGALVGSGLQGGASVLELQEDHVLRCVVPLPEVDAVGISKGTPVTITFPGVGGAPLASSVSRTSGALASASRAMRVEIDLPNGDGALTPGQYARVAFSAERTTDVWLLPVASRVMHDDRATVLVVGPDNRVVRRPIVEGRSNASHFEVLGAGWSAGDRVIIAGKSLVRPGDQVEAVSLEITD